MATGSYVVYLAHPVSGDVAGNVKRALAWLRVVRACRPTWTVIAPWLAALASGEDDSDPASRERGLRDCEAVVSRCDGIVLCGGRISSGMQRELDAGVGRRDGRPFDVHDLTHIGDAPADLDGLALA